MSDSESDMEISLSANALAALQEFQQEEQTRREQFAKLYQQAEDGFEELQKEKIGIEMFPEDWNLSQFWYSDKTADILADELLEGADEDTVVAVVSAPSVYAAIKKRDNLPTEHIYLFEFDKRFELLAGKKYFSFYDYANPLEFPEHLKGKVDRLLIDPPFLSDECQTKSSITAHAMLTNDKSGKTKNGTQKYRLISCTGERMAELISKVYNDTKMTTFHPEHSNGLSNEFRCYASFEGKHWNFQ